MATQNVTGGATDTTLTKEQLLGQPGRWRRFGEPKPAGTPDENGTPDYGIFGPGSMAWEVILNPSTIVFLTAIQGLVQATSFKPIVAGLRDRDPTSRKSVDGTLTIFDVYERAARNAGMHAPMWLGDTKTAQLMAKHLHNFHKRVTGDTIDIGRPQLGGYAASEPRESMWAAITELHPMLWAYEAFAFRDGKLPHRLTAQQRDQYIAEMAEYLRLVGSNEDEIPHNMAELASLYKKYEPLFNPSETIGFMPENGENQQKLAVAAMKNNFNRSQLKAFVPVLIQFVIFGDALVGAVSGKARWSMGVGPLRSRWTLIARRLFLPVAWLVQQPVIENYFLKRMWGPDATAMIRSARVLHKAALEKRAHGLAQA
jgi:uncharacterized protein (DUF2236 family)